MRNKYPNLIVSDKDTILSVLKKMDASNRKLLIVLDGDTFVSVISIGDIQRAIIKNINLNTPIDKILRKEVSFAFENDDLGLVKEKMKARRNELMPVISKKYTLVDIIFWEDLFKETYTNVSIPKFKFPVIIMAGGIGSRLKPLTNILPKALIPIGEKSIIEQIMDKFCNIGCNTFYISLNYKAEMIKYYFSTLDNSDYQINYLQEESPLGTAGSLHLLKGVIDSTFIVSNCDILVDQNIADIIEYHRENKNEITVVAALKYFPIPYGIIETGLDGQLLELIEKPEITYKINSGMYIIEPHLLNEIPVNQFFHITQLIEKVNKRQGKIGVFPISEKSWKDIGNWEEYLQLIKK